MKSQPRSASPYVPMAALAVTIVMLEVVYETGDEDELRTPFWLWAAIIFTTETVFCYIARVCCTCYGQAQDGSIDGQERSDSRVHPETCPSGSDKTPWHQRYLPKWLNRDEHQEAKVPPTYHDSRAEESPSEFRSTFYESPERSLGQETFLSPEGQTIWEQREEDECLWAIIITAVLVALGTAAGTCCLSIIAQDEPFFSHLFIIFFKCFSCWTSLPDDLCSPGVV